MKTYHRAWTAITPTAGIELAVLVLMGMAAAVQAEVAFEAGVQVLTRGPVHEAFAEESMMGATA